MSTDPYQEIWKQVQRLTPDDQLRLLKDLTEYLRHPKHSVLELEGLGKEAWQGIDVKEYIDQERDSWDKQPPHNITEFKGFARELWSGVDVEKYLDEERNSWDG